MRKIDAIIERLENIKYDAVDVVKHVLEQNEQTIVEIVRDDQLYDQGINGRGVKIDSYLPYAESTKRYKRSKSQPYNRVTLSDKRDFYDGFYVDFLSDGLRVFSTDYKAEHLADRYGSSIFAITDENKRTKLSALVRPAIVKLIRNG